MGRCGTLVLPSLSWRSWGSAVPLSLDVPSTHHRPQPQATSLVYVICLTPTAFEFVSFGLKRGVCTVTADLCAGSLLVGPSWALAPWPPSPCMRRQGHAPLESGWPQKVSAHHPRLRTTGSDRSQNPFSSASLEVNFSKGGPEASSLCVFIT